MKIGALAASTGLSAHALRYYERIGLLPRIHRDRSRQRDYDPSILTWIAFLDRLKTTGMPIKGMLAYARLRESGVGTEAERAGAHRVVPCRDRRSRHQARCRGQRYGRDRLEDLARTPHHRADSRKRRRRGR